MRQFQQKQILDCIQTLDDVIAEMKRLFLSNETYLLMGMLTDCQQFTVKIGEFIEQTDSEHTSIIKLLENFCEKLYFVAVEIDTGELAADFYKPLTNSVREIRKQVKTKLIPDKFEVAFFPYKASMWDALESIWFTAKEDPQCEVYVVPIPYFENSNGTLGKMHYEGDMYPDYVPIMNWEEYDVQERHPDVAFIHNPYDGGNYVTSVHPTYYSKNLKKHTDLLAYVPYFVTQGAPKESFILSAGVLHSDMVFVDTVLARETYLEVIKNYEKENNKQGVFGVLKEKIVSTGSPKMDKVVHSKKEDYALPGEWRKSIYGPDGSRKKIVLYNMTLTEALSGGEEYLEKCSDVVDSFCDHSQIVLWWRPHPLLENTYKSMRPSLYKKYCEFVLDYKKKCSDYPNFIYDNTGDLHRAITWSDAYYGDWSSVVMLYQSTGKPMMVQNIKYKNIEENRILPWCFCVGERYVWFVLVEFSMLFKIDRETYEITEVVKIPGEEEFLIKGWLYWSVEEYRGKVYFSPYTSKDIVIFDIESAQFTKIPLREPDVDKIVKDTSYTGVIPCGDYIYFTPCDSSEIIRMNIFTFAVDYFDDWYEELNKIKEFPKAGSDPHLHKFIVPCFASGSIWLAAHYGANAVIEFNTTTLRSKVYKVSDEEYHYGLIRFDGENFWLSPWEFQGEPTVKWHPEKGVLKEFYDMHLGTENKPTLLWTKIAGDYLHFIPWVSEHGYKVNTKTDEVSIDACFELTDVPVTAGKFLSVRKRDNILYTFNHSANKFVEVNLATGERKESTLKFADSCTKTRGCLQMVYFRNTTGWVEDDPYKTIYFEGPELSLSGYLYHISTDEYDAEVLQPERIKAVSKFDGNAGKRIYEVVKKQALRRTR